MPLTGQVTPEATSPEVAFDAPAEGRDERRHPEHLAFGFLEELVARRVDFKVRTNPFSALKYAMDVDRYLCISEGVRAVMRESGVPEGAYGDWARVSIGTREEMDLFLSEIAKILGKT